MLKSGKAHVKRVLVASRSRGRLMSLRPNFSALNYLLGCRRCHLFIFHYARIFLSNGPGILNHAPHQRSRRLARTRVFRLRSRNPSRPLPTRPIRSTRMILWVQVAMYVVATAVLINSLTSRSKIKFLRTSTSVWSIPFSPIKPRTARARTRLTTMSCTRSTTKSLRKARSSFWS